jgi:hypothetical protein
MSFGEQSITLVSTGLHSNQIVLDMSMDFEGSQTGDEGDKGKSAKKGRDYG